MPSPIAHSISGYALSRLPFTKRQLPGQILSITPSVALYAIFISSLPDLDFVPQIVTGLKFHRGPSHSLFAAIAISAVLASIVTRIHHKTHYSGVFKLTFGLYAVHLCLDLLTTGGSGVPLLWPLYDHTFSAPFALFPPVHHSRGLWDVSHLTFIGVELLYAVILWVGVRLIKGRSKTRTSQS